MDRGSLHSILHDLSIPISWELMLSMIQDSVRGMIYLHTCQPPIFHRDLKSQNLLVDEFWRCKVSDFGLSTAVTAELQEESEAMGTVSWSAPEVFKSGHYSTKTDVYSFGIVLWECLCRAEPYHGIPAFKVISMVGEGKRPEVPSWCPAPYENLMTRCWSDNPSLRPEFSDILKEMEHFVHDDWKDEPGLISSCGSATSSVEDTSSILHPSLIMSPMSSSSSSSASSTTASSH